MNAGREPPLFFHAVPERAGLVVSRGLLGAAAYAHALRQLLGGVLGGIAASGAPRQAAAGGGERLPARARRRAGAAVQGEHRAARRGAVPPRACSRCSPAALRAPHVLFVAQRLAARHGEFFAAGVRRGGTFANENETIRAGRWEAGVGLEKRRATSDGSAVRRATPVARRDRVEKNSPLVAMPPPPHPLPLSARPRRLLGPPRQPAGSVTSARAAFAALAATWASWGEHRAEGVGAAQAVLERLGVRLGVHRAAEDALAGDAAGQARVLGAALGDERENGAVQLAPSIHTVKQKRRALARSVRWSIVSLLKRTTRPHSATSTVAAATAPAAARRRRRPRG